MKTTTEMQLVPIAKLVPYVNNARTHSPEQITKLRSSLREFPSRRRRRRTPQSGFPRRFPVRKRNWPG